MPPKETSATISVCPGIQTCVIRRARFRRDGDRAPAAIIGSTESLAFDRTALDQAIRHSYLLVVAGTVQDKIEYVRRSADIVRAWFVDPDKAMRPSFRYAQWLGNAGDGGAQPNPYGLIDARDLWVLPELVRSLVAAGAINQQETTEIRQWCTSLLDELMEEAQGRDAYRATNNIGTFTHLLLTSMALFTNRFQEAADLLNAAPLRLVAGMDASGLPVEEINRAQPLHYCLFNLSAWICLATVGRAVGFDLWAFEGVEGQSVCRMLGAVATRREGFSDYAHSPLHFDERIERLIRLVPENAAGRQFLTPLKRLEGPCWQNHPDAGLPPLWPAIVTVRS